MTDLLSSILSRLSAGGTDTGPSSYAAPGSAEYRRRQRVATAQANVAPSRPRAGESFAAYNARSPALSDPAFPAFGFMMSPQRAPRFNANGYTLQTDTGRSRSDRRERMRQHMRGFEIGQAVARGAINIANAPGMNVFSIPMGARPQFPGSPTPEGATRATSATYDAEGHPVALNMGVIAYGQDFRRPFDEVMGDVEKAAGAPSRLLTFINRRELPVGGYYTDGPDSTSARGPFQFTGGTWRTWSNPLGRMYGVPDTMQGEERLSLRDDARMAGAMTAEELRYFWNRYRQSAPNDPNASVADLYMAHWGGDQALPLVLDVRHQQGSRAATSYFTGSIGQQVIDNHPRDFFVRGDRSQPRTAGEFYAWMTGNDPGTPQLPNPHRKNYMDNGRLTGLPTTPVEFGPRADGSREPASVERPGVVVLPSDSPLLRNNQ